MSNGEFVTRDELQTLLKEHSSETRRFLAEQAEESRRLMETLVEHVTSQVQIVAEGHSIQVGKLDHLTEVVTGHTHQIQELGTAVAALRTDFTGLRAGQEELRTGLGEVRAEVHELRTGLGEVRAEVHEFRTGLGEVRAEVHELRTGLGEVRAEVHELRTGQDDLRADMTREFGELRSLVSLSYTELDGRLRFLEHEVTDLRTRLERLEAHRTA